MSGRPKEPRIDNPATHPKRWVNLSVAAEFLGMTRRTVNAFIDEGKLDFEMRGRCPKIHVDELVRFKGWLKEQRLAS